MLKSFVLVERNKETCKESYFNDGSYSSRKACELALEIRKSIREMNGTLEKYEFFIRRNEKYDLK